MTYLLTLRIRAGKGTSSYKVLLEREIPFKQGGGLGPIVLPEDAQVLEIEFRGLRRVAVRSIEEAFAQSSPYYEVVSEEELQEEPERDLSAGPQVMVGSTSISCSPGFVPPDPPRCTCGGNCTPTQHGPFCPWLKWWDGLDENYRSYARLKWDLIPGADGKMRVRRSG